MRTREPILAIGVCAVLALGGAGCGSDDNNDKSKESSSARGAGLLALSSSAQKITRVSANVGGLEGSTKPKSGKTTGLQPGDQLNLAGLPPNIIQTVKQQTGVDVQVQCPSSVTYSPGSVFYCQLTTPDGTAYQVECTQQPGGGVQWKVVTTQPTPPPPPGPSQQKLKGNTGKAKATGARKTGDALDISSLASNIETKVKQQTGLDVNVECPATVDYSPASVFYCKLYTSDGTAYDVKCTQGQDGSISWEVLVGQTGKNASTSKFSSDAKKIASLSAKSHGLAATAKKSPGATGLSEG